MINVFFEFKKHCMIDKYDVLMFCNGNVSRYFISQLESISYYYKPFFKFLNPASNTINILTSSLIHFKYLFTSSKFSFLSHISADDLQISPYIFEWLDCIYVIVGNLYRFQYFAILATFLYFIFWGMYLISKLLLIFMDRICRC